MPAFIDRREQSQAASEPRCGQDRGQGPARVLDPHALVAHRLLLYRVARVLCRSHEEAEDLVQETFARVLARPRMLHSGDDLRYLLGALRNTHTTRRRVAARRPVTMPMDSADLAAAFDVQSLVEARGVITAIAAAPAPYRDAVVAVDLLGLSYEQAARRLATSKRTIGSRVFRGRAHIARLLDAGVSG
jgi:RNA polymerase sigma-70 factor (ECF subfamily)